MDKNLKYKGKTLMKINVNNNNGDTEYILVMKGMTTKISREQYMKALNDTDHWKFD